MTRELKFRVWNPTNNSFLDLTADGWGYYYLTLDGKFMVHYNGGFGNPTETKELNYMVVQQYTGAVDKNGKEIYEGDNLSYKGQVGTIEFFAAAFYCCWNDQTDNDLSYMMTADMEVIGNIYEGNNKIDSVVSTDTIEINDSEKLDKCESCGEDGWDGYICHSCGLKDI